MRVHRLTTQALNRQLVSSRPWPHLDGPLARDQEIWALQISVHDRWVSLVQVRHSLRGVQQLQKSSSVQPWDQAGELCRLCKPELQTD